MSGVCERCIVGTTPSHPLDGRLDQITAPAVRRRFSLLQAMGYRHFFVNLASLTALDQEGIAAFYGILDEARESGGSLCLTNLNGQFQQLVDASKRTANLPTYPTVEAALADFPPLSTPETNET